MVAVGLIAEVPAGFLAWRVAVLVTLDGGLGRLRAVHREGVVVRTLGRRWWCQMSRPTRFQSPALESLAQQLRFAAPAALTRQIERIEELSLELDPERNYPEDWLITRICGVRPEIESPALFVGRALVGDLSTLAERLSDAAAHRAAELDVEPMLTLEELCSRWEVSPKTVQRYRRLGLIARRVRAASGGSRHAFRLAHVQLFEARHKERIDAARGFSRLDDDARHGLLMQAAEMQRERPRSLNQAAVELARQSGRALETVRQILLKHDQRAASVGEPALFAHRGPPGSQERHLVERATFRGIEAEAIAKRLGRSAASIRRVAAACRAERIMNAGLSAVVRASVGEEVLADPRVSEGLGLPGPTDVRDLLELAATMPAPDMEAEVVRVTAVRALLARAARGAAELEHQRSAIALIDQIETDLRWVARLTAELVRSQLPVIVRAIESGAQRPVAEIKGVQLVPLLVESMRAAGEAIDGFDPAHGSRLAGAVGLATTRVVARAIKSGAVDPLPRTRRAAAMVGAGVCVPDFTRVLMPRQLWEGRWWLEPPLPLRAAALGTSGSLDERARKTIAWRFGFGGRPRTMVEVARLLRLPPVRAAVVLRDACRAARGIALPVG